MPSTKICRAITTEIDGVTSYAPESPDLIDRRAINIHPDEDGVQWYWAPDAPIPDAPSQPER